MFFIITIMKLRNFTDKNKKDIILELKSNFKKDKKKIWLALAKHLNKPKRNLASVNLSKINYYAKDNDTIFVAGKILGNGIIDKKLVLSSFKVSNTALEKINKSNSKYIDLKKIMDLKKINNIRIIK
ncbi:MAG: 50S ribosomal protein L18e [Candidatus Aenigmarchaeota archaeon ex4484_52]|nr:MAG: 50S ribosomal protein L18e [Candidatus Aenigmarchaeota archaeon ex4484_52]